MNINNADLAAVAVKPAQFPATDLPEVAFVGRSNVGKSSLINTMLGRKKLARTSQNPGKTRTINFFGVGLPGDLSGSVGGKATADSLYFVDLPGYGYARISRSESEKWGAMVEGYLKNRPQLKRVFLLLDIRHEPNSNDLMLWEWLCHYDIPITLVATKSDKLKRSQVERHLKILATSLETAKPIPFSSQTRDGRDALWQVILDSCINTML